MHIVIYGGYTYRFDSLHIVTIQRYHPAHARAHTQTQALSELARAVIGSMA